MRIIKNNISPQEQDALHTCKRHKKRRTTIEMQTIRRVRIMLLPYAHYQLRSKQDINAYKASNYNFINRTQNNLHQ